MLRMLGGLAALALLPLAAPAQLLAPAVDPPRLEGAPEPELRTPRAFAPDAAGAAGLDEWTLHRSADGAHPDGVEQAYVWLMNRARQDPAAEGVFLAGITEFGVANALLFFDVDVELLIDEFAAIAPKPPAAFDVRLYEGALAHSLDLIARDAQDHDGQFDRVAAAGFLAQAMRGNVFSYSREALYGHAAFNVDWGGNDGTGMQTGRGHRRAIMSIDGEYTNVGIAAVAEQSSSTAVGPSVVTGNYARASSSAPNHYNRFLVGTVWEDLDGDGCYDPGEGLGGVEVLPSRGPWYAVTAAGGGYAVPILEPGPIAVEFAGSGVPPHTATAQVGSTSVLLDYELSSTPVPEPRAAAAGLAAGLALAALARGRAGQAFRHHPR